MHYAQESGIMHFLLLKKLMAHVLNFVSAFIIVYFKQNSSYIKNCMGQAKLFLLKWILFKRSKVMVDSQTD